MGWGRAWWEGAWGSSRSTDTVYELVVGGEKGVEIGIGEVDQTHEERVANELQIVARQEKQWGCCGGGSRYAKTHKIPVKHYSERHAGPGITSRPMNPILTGERKSLRELPACHGNHVMQKVCCKGNVEKWRNMAAVNVLGKGKQRRKGWGSAWWWG